MIKVGLLDIAWRKSSFSNTGNCVEVARGRVGVLVRDSKDPAGLVLPVTVAGWRAFLVTVTASSCSSLSRTGVLFSAPSRHRGARYFATVRRDHAVSRGRSV
ncbi:MAG: DUF397 domain-containing protein [Pseudonocardiaceae bacterium]